jgi:hypothetical protein
VGVGVTVALLAWVLRDVSPREVWAHARSAHPGYLTAAVVAATSTFVLRIFRWRLLLRSDDGRPLARAPLWHGIAIGFMANNILPFRAGELLRALAISRLAPVRVSSALSSLLVERLFDGLTVIGLMLVGLVSAGIPTTARIGDIPVTSLATRAALLSGVLLLACIGALVFPGVAKGLLRRMAPARLAERLGRVVDGLRAGVGSLASPARVAGVAAWSLAVWAVNGSAFLLAYRAFDLNVGYGGALLQQGVISFLIAAPSTPGFFGPFEAAIKAVLALFGIASESAVSYALTYHFTTFAPITLLGLWSLARSPVSLSSIQETAAGTTSASTGR